MPRKPLKTLGERGAENAAAMIKAIDSFGQFPLQTSERHGSGIIVYSKRAKQKIPYGMRKGWARPDLPDTMIKTMIREFLVDGTPARALAKRIGIDTHEMNRLIGGGTRRYLRAEVEEEIEREARACSS